MHLFTFSLRIDFSLSIAEISLFKELNCKIELNQHSTSDNNVSVISKRLIYNNIS